MNLNPSAVKAAIIKSSSHALLVGKKVSPDVLVAAGVVGLVGATVLACRGTLKLENTVDNMNDDVEDFKKKAVHALKTESYTDLDYKTDLAKVYTKNIVEIVRRINGLRRPPGISLTTNGLRLVDLAAPLAAAGLERVNISLDTLLPERFAQLTGADTAADNTNNPQS